MRNSAKSMLQELRKSLTSQIKALEESFDAKLSDLSKKESSVEGQLKNLTHPKSSLSFSCPAVNSFFLALPFHHIDDQQVLSFCCELSLRFPHVTLKDSGKETIRDWLHLRSQFIAEGKAEYGDEITVSSQCINCPQYQLGKWEPSDKVTMVHFSITPAPCQGKCIYCEVVKMPRKFNDPITQESYRRAFDALEYADQTGLISPDAKWLISSGEISIHPYKDKIYDMVKEKDVTFFTNAFIYDEAIGSILANNSLAKLELSIDSGTPASWKSIKQHDNFPEVVDNLRSYHKESLVPNQIILKYILLPGLNDTQEDYAGVINIMKEIDVTDLVISRERRSYDLTDEEHESLITSVARLAAELKKNEMTYTLHSYSPQERQEIGILSIQ